MTNPGGQAAPASALPDQYKAYLEDLGRIGGRHETARQFYLSLVSAISAFVALATGEGPLSRVGMNGLAIVLFAGLFISLMWAAHMRSFGKLFAAKLHVLRALEKARPVEGQLFEAFVLETKILSGKAGEEEGAGRGGWSWTYMRITLIDTLVPLAFAVIYAAFLIGMR